MPTATEMKTKTERQIVPPFGIEADHLRNCDLLLQSIPNCRLRSRIKAGRTAKDAKTGEHVIPVDQSRHLGVLPEIPGMQLHVNSSTCSYQVIDPLHDDEDLCARIARALDADERPTGGRGIKGAEPLRGKLDVHRMKTLCREVIWLLESESAKVVKGTEPDLEDVEKLPGKFLLNPGSRVHNMQPRYEEDLEAWVDKLAASGG